jgi:hypothetical protein
MEGRTTCERSEIVSRVGNPIRKTRRRNYRAVQYAGVSQGCARTQEAGFGIAQAGLTVYVQTKRRLLSLEEAGATEPPVGSVRSLDYQQDPIITQSIYVGRTPRLC